MAVAVWEEEFFLYPIDSAIDNMNDYCKQLKVQAEELYRAAELLGSQLTGDEAKLFAENLKKMNERMKQMIVAADSYKEFLKNEWEKEMEKADMIAAERFR